MSLELPPAPIDSLPVREAGVWVKEKLNILNCYLNAFVQASKKAGGCFYADGFAGPGINVVRETGERVCGSPLIALQCGFTACLCIEFRKEMATALAHRVKPYSPRGKVSQGDINLHLVPLMKKHFDPYKPWLCVLDPEGTELDWRTIEAISKSKARGRKPELLILLPDTGFVRTLWLERDLEEWAELAMLRIFGNEEWREIFEARKRGLSPDEARTRYVRLYAEGIRNLDYEFVLDRQIRKPDGSPLYFLLFATDHHVGRELMDHCFDRIWSPEGGQLSLLTKQPRGRRLPK